MVLSDSGSGKVTTSRLLREKMPCVTMASHVLRCGVHKYVGQRMYTYHTDPHGEYMPSTDPHGQYMLSTYVASFSGLSHLQSLIVFRSILLTAYVTIEPPGEAGESLV